MRPRHKAAENAVRRAAGPLVGCASMRPRHKAAENSDAALAIAAAEGALQ